MYEYRAVILRVIDGDTFEADVDLGLNVWLRKQTFRLYGIDTPEIRTNKARGVGQKQVEHGLAAKARVNELIGPETVSVGGGMGEYTDERPRIFTIRTHKDDTGKYGRWLADVVLPDPNQHGFLSQQLHIEGFAKRDDYDE